MKPRDIVLEQIRHHETNPVPYTLPFEEDVGVRLDKHFGDAAWRGRLARYIAQCGSVAKPPREQLDSTHHRDAFGTVWRTDELPPSVVEPGLKAPTFEGYAFPSAGAYLDAAVKAAAKERIAQSSGYFTIVSTGLCLWQSWYVRGLETTLVEFSYGIRRNLGREE